VNRRVLHSRWNDEGDQSCYDQEACAVPDQR
jgi:hypothetical protein